MLESPTSTPGSQSVQSKDYRNCRSVRLYGEGEHLEADLGQRDLISNSRWEIPETPSYPPLLSRSIPGQIKGLEWMTMAGRTRFEFQEAQLLSQWGVTSNYKSTCILVPQIWSDVNPLALARDFNHDTFAQLDMARMVQIQPLSK